MRTFASLVLFLVLSYGRVQAASGEAPLPDKPIRYVINTRVTGRF